MRARLCVQDRARRSLPGLSWGVRSGRSTGKRPFGVERPHGTPLRKPDIPGPPEPSPRRASKATRPGGNLRSGAAHMAETVTPIRSGSTRQASIELGSLRVTDVVFPPWLSLPSHYHPRACFALILEGSVDKTFRTATYPSPPSTLVTMPPEERHVDRFERGGAHLLVIEPVDAADDLLLPCAGVLDCIHHYRDAGLMSLAWRAARELALPDAVSPLVI